MASLFFNGRGDRHSGKRSKLVGGRGVRLGLDRAVLLDYAMAERRKFGAAAGWATVFRFDDPLTEHAVERVDQQPARRYDMAIIRPAAEMEPWSRTASSSLIFP